MKFIKVIATVSLAASALASPTVFPRTEGFTKCGEQNNGIESCCQQKVVQKPLSTVLPDLKGDGFSGILELLRFLAIIFQPNVGVASGCSPIVGVILNPTLNTCKSQNVCCFNSLPDSHETSTGGLINFAPKVQPVIALCPGLAAA